MSNIYSFSPFGYEGSIIRIESDVRRGIPATDIVGLADGAVKESRERMQAAIRNSGLEYPPERVLISLSPADLKKEGAGFDLPVAISVLNANEKEQKNLPSVLIMGELELSGKTRPVRGIYAAGTTAMASGIEYAIVPKENEQEMKSTGMKTIGVTSLEEAYRNYRNINEYHFEKSNESQNDTSSSKVKFNEEELKRLKETYPKEIKNFNLDDIRALEIAIAGKHNLQFWGAPGCGKTMMIQQFVPALTPNNTLEESQSVNRIWSLAGLKRPNEGIDTKTPFRIPHQTASIEGICGGGPNCRPGEISLAHNGILFLDETNEFRSSVIQMLRVPMENHSITLSRAGRTTVYPANFQYYGATNPCPCGCYGSHDKICLDSLKSIEQYHKKMGAPFIDRIAIQKFVDSRDENFVENRNYTVNDMVKHITKAYELQREKGVYNGKMAPNDILEFCQIDEETRKYLDNSTLKYDLTPRQIANTMKVALTIANMDGRKNIELEDLKESVEYARPKILGNQDINKHYYHFEPKEENVSVNTKIDELEKQKEFLEESHKTFSETVDKNTENINAIKKENQLNENLSEEEKKAILSNAESESQKTENKNTNDNVKKTGRK